MNSSNAAVTAADARDPSDWWTSAAHVSIALVLLLVLNWSRLPI